jgi:flagellar hook-length control protein FliK
VEIAAKSQSGAKQFDIRLDPPELGRVQVRLSIDATGKAEAHLSADQPQTLDLLQKDAPALARALREAGLDVNQDGLNFSLRSQQQNAGNGQNGNGQDSTQNGRNAFLSGKSLETVSPTGSAYSGGLGLLDIKV